LWLVVVTYQAQSTMIYNLYIFNKKGVCLFYYEFHRPLKAENLEEEQQLLFGFLRAIVTFVERVSPVLYAPSVTHLAHQANKPTVSF